MGQCYRHDDDETSSAGGEFHSVIRQLQEQGVPNHKIIHAAMAELHGLASEASRDSGREAAKESLRG